MIPLTAAHQGLRVLLVLAAGVGAGYLQAAFGVTAQAQTVVLTRADCARLVAHRPTPDATYRPGIDVRGRPVAPADLPGTPQIAFPDQIVLDITVDIQQRFGIPATSSFYKPEAQVGRVVVDPDGMARFNGQPLTDPEQGALAFLCQRQAPLGPR